MKITHQRRPKRTQRRQPILRFTPTAWVKLLFLRDRGPTEVGGFGIATAGDLLLVTDIQLVKQVCTFASVVFDDDAVADFFDRQVDLGRGPERFARIWIHTHPGKSPEPSSVDEETFARVFGRTDWSVMFILARGGDSYARLEFNAGPGGALLLPVKIDCRQPFAASDHSAWQAEYDVLVQELPKLQTATQESSNLKLNPVADGRLKGFSTAHERFYRENPFPEEFEFGF